ncbi:hypothetical protein N431DRAFT_514058 [Stipitochalara longipes BDJ]|nr:hypothetical protein N431DRAFT_514058 [Stipitochalara longipes BDJ]
MGTECQPRRFTPRESEKEGSCKCFQFLRLTPDSESSPKIPAQRDSNTGPDSSNGPFLILTPDVRTSSTILAHQISAANPFLQLTADIEGPSRIVDSETCEAEHVSSSENTFLKLTSPHDGSSISARKVSAAVASGLPTLSPIGNLPPELQLMALKNLPLQEVKNFRVTSRSWATAGMEHLFRGQFSVRPKEGILPRIDFLDDLSKLESLCQHPYFSHDIKSISFLKSDMSRKMFSLFLLHKKRRTTHHQWDSILHGIRSPTQTYCERSILEKLFTALPNLSCIDIMSVENYLNKLEDNAFILHGDFDEYMASRKELRTLLFAFARRRYTAILLAANQLRSPLYSLTVSYLPTRREVHPLPYGVLEANEATRKTMSKVENMTFHLAFNPDIRTTPSNYDLIFLTRAIGNYLKCFRNLRRLDLGMAEEESSRHRPFMAEFQRALWLIQPEILPFILNHSATLRHLEIAPGRCEPKDQDQDTEEFLTTIKDQCKCLEKFSFLKGEWAEKTDKIYNIIVFPSRSWIWEPVLDESTEPIKASKLIEYYILGRCPWPMVPENPFDVGLWRPKFAGTHEQFLDMSQEQLDHYFERGWETVVGYHGFGSWWDSEIEADSDTEEAGPETERDTDLASLNYLLAMEYTKPS